MTGDEKDDAGLQHDGLEELLRADGMTIHHPVVCTECRTRVIVTIPDELDHPRFECVCSIGDTASGFPDSWVWKGKEESHV